jgi:hypothetical protein
MAEQAARRLAVHGAGGDEVLQHRKKAVPKRRLSSRRVEGALRGSYA